MKTLQLSSYGAPTEVVEFAGLDPADPGPGEVAVEIEAAPINPSDLMIMGVYCVRPELRAALGAEGVGRGIAAGEGVDVARGRPAAARDARHQPGHASRRRHAQRPGRGDVPAPGIPRGYRPRRPGRDATARSSSHSSTKEHPMNIEGSVALVTGANRGLGAAFARDLLDRGAAKVYAAVRDPDTVSDPRLTPIRLDVTDRASIERAARTAADVTLLINNAGVFTGTTTLGDEAGLRQELEVNYLGPVAVSRAFAPILAANGGGALVNVLSALSWVTFPTSGGYSSAKAAMWAATNSLRQDLLEQGTLVTAVHVGYIDTDMAVDAPKTAPEIVSEATLDGVEAGLHEVLADEPARQVRAALSGPLSGLYPVLADAARV
jgi:NAD(P)-dependent dehydrogenase (short-subunit alcohol dehydrogenase family)